MTITPEQREKYARIGEAAMGEWWNQDEERIPWDEAQEIMRMDFTASAEAVALAAQRDLVLAMIADAESETMNIVLHDFLFRFLPADPSPQEDRLAHSVHIEVTDAMRKAAGRVFLEKTGGKPFGGPSGVMQEALNAALEAAFAPKEPFSE